MQPHDLYRLLCTRSHSSLKRSCSNGGIFICTQSIASVAYSLLGFASTALVWRRARYCRPRFLPISAVTNRQFADIPMSRDACVLVQNHSRLPILTFRPCRFQKLCLISEQRPGLSKLHCPSNQPRCGLRSD